MNSLPLDGVRRCDQLFSVADPEDRAGAKEVWGQSPQPGVHGAEPPPGSLGHRRNFVFDDGDLSPQLLKVVVTVTTTFSKWNLQFFKQF